MCDAASRVFGSSDLLRCILAHLVDVDEDSSVRGGTHLRRVCNALRDAFDELYFTHHRGLTLLHDIPDERRSEAAAALRACLARFLPRCRGALTLGVRCIGFEGDACAPDLPGTLQLNCQLLRAAAGLGLTRLELRVPEVLAAALCRPDILPACPASLAHLAIEVTEWIEARTALDVFPSHHPVAKLFNGWETSVDTWVARLVRPLTTLQSLSFAWGLRADPRYAAGDFRLGILAPSLPPSLTSLSMRLGTFLARDCSFSQLRHLAGLQHLTLHRVLCFHEAQEVPSTLSALTALHLYASHWSLNDFSAEQVEELLEKGKENEFLTCLSRSLAALPNLRCLAACVDRLTAWSDQLPASLTWLHLDSYTDLPGDFSWSRLPELRHLRLRHGHPNFTSWRPLRLDLAALPPSLESLGCTRVRLSSSTTGSVLGALGHITTLCLDNCTVDGEAASAEGFSMAPSGLAALWRLRDLHLASPVQHGQPLSQLGGAVADLHAITRLHLEGTALDLSLLPPNLQRFTGSGLEVASGAGADDTTGPLLPTTLPQLTRLQLSKCKLLPGAAGALATAIPALCRLRLLECEVQPTVVPREPRGWEVSVVRHVAVPEPRIIHRALRGGNRSRAGACGLLPTAAVLGTPAYLSSVAEPFEGDDRLDYFIDWLGFAERLPPHPPSAPREEQLRLPAAEDVDLELDASFAAWASGRYSLSRAHALPWAYL